MRRSEWVQIITFAYFGILAWTRPLPYERRVKASVIAAGGLLATLAGAWILPAILPLLAAEVVRDWLPAALMLVVYREAGLFFIRVDSAFQDRLLRIDAMLAAPFLRFLSRNFAGRVILGYLDLTYLLCYPMIPLSAGALYVFRLRPFVDQFWMVVLISTYLSYGMLPFFQTLPPRVLNEPWLIRDPPNPIRRFNLWILRNGSIHANTFPSAHVASSTAAALVLGQVAPSPTGIVFGAIAAGITFGTFAGRYHYVADAVLGCLIALMVFIAVQP